MVPRRVFAAVVAGLVVLGAPAAGTGHAAGTLWQVGVRDGSYRELALAGHYAEYASRFPHDVTFRIGHSRVQADWPYIHPGPSDPWARSRVHPFRIEFGLKSAPVHACRLNLHLVDARHDGQQLVEVDINGLKQYRFLTEPGATEASLTDPAAGRQSTLSVPFPASLLHKGANHITLAVVGGCWLLYDAVSLETGTGVPPAPVVAGLSAVLRPGGQTGPGEIALSVTNAGQEGEAEVCVAGQGAGGRPVHLMPGPNQLALALTSPLLAGGAVVSVRAGGREETVAVQQPAVIWRIGAPDGDYGEFAIAGHYPAYSERFPGDVVFRVGQSDPRRDWPFIQPSQWDSWAGTRPHPFRIEFALPQAPKGSAELVIGLVDTQSRGGPVLQVGINDRASYRVQLPTGASDDSLTNPRVGRAYRFSVPIAASLLRAGDNHVVLTVVSGGWLVYDDLCLQVGSGVPDGPEPGGIAAAATPLFRRVAGSPRQLVRVATRNAGVQGEVEVCLDGGVTARERVTLIPGENVVGLLVPPVERPVPVTVTLRGGGVSRQARFIAEPQRRWRVYVGPSTHTDIGYTDFQERVYARHNGNTARALAACATSPGFRWNLEVGYQAALLRKADPAGYRALLAQIREGRIGLGALYLNMLTGLCSGEELVRTVTFVQDMAREAGATADAACLTDVPTAIGTLPMLLSQGGVRTFTDGANDCIPFQWGGRAMDQQPYWWEGLDGSRVLAITARTYAQAGTLGMLDDVATIESRLPEWLRQIGREGYPCDAAYVYGAFSDNQPMDPRYESIAAAWNARWDYPRIIVARGDEFFRDVEAQAGSKLPVVRGDLGVVWEDGAASTARETALVRQAKARLETAERWLALSAALGGAPFPVGRVRNAWDQVLLFDEHTWGAAGSVTEPDSEQTRHQWAVKAAFAEGAREQAADLLTRGLAAFGGCVSASQATVESGLVTVFNESSWPRDILASAPLPEGAREVEVVEAGRGHRAVPCQREAGEAVFMAREVPALGWRAYRITRTAAPAGAPGLLRAGTDPWSWETPDFRLRVDPATGALSSLYDKELRTEWIAGTGGLGGNQLVYVTGEMFGTFDPEAPLPVLTSSTHTAATVELVQNGPARAVLHIARQGPEAPATDTYLVVQPGRRIELLNVVHKAETLVKEAAYFAFPFRLEARLPRAAFVELPYGVLQVEKDQAPGAGRDWYATHSFAAVSDGRRTACLASPHTPMLTLNDIYRGRRVGRVPELNGCLFAYAMNNYWGTNYKASQGGDLVFAFALDLRAGVFDGAGATRFGWDALATMADPAAGASADVWRRATPAAGGAPSALEGSAVEVSGGVALVGGITWRGGRLVLRLYNPSPRPSRTWVRLPGRVIAGAWVADLNGTVQRRLAVAPAGGRVQVEVGGRSLTTTVLKVVAARGQRAAELR